MTIGSRIESRLVALGMSQAELARQVKIRQSSINALVRGETRSSRHLHDIARVLQTTTAYLMEETDDPRTGTSFATPAVVERTVADADFVSIAAIDQDYGLGGTYVDGPVDQEVMLFPRLWVESITHAPPEMLTWTRGKGDSMLPTIHSGDLVLFNRAERTILEQDALWVFSIGDVGAIKRLRLRGRRVTILSDNPLVDPDEADADEVNLIGRVVFIGKRY